MRIFLVLLAPFLLANAETQDTPAPPPPTIPAPLKAMLDAAIASGNESDVTTVVKYTSLAAPDSAKAIREVAAKWRAEKTADRRRTIQEAGVFDLWSGRAELGGWLTTGNAESLGLTGKLDLQRDGLNWRNKLHLQADYQRSLGVVSREHYLAAYEPNYKLGSRSYIYGAGQYESDRFLGYYDRYSVSAGIGYSAIKQPGLTLNLELGPAYRNTSFTDGTRENAAAARGSLDFDWNISKGIALSQDASVYAQSENSTATSMTAIHAKLIGPLAAQLSYNVQYESSPPIGRVSTDTTTRAGLSYSF